MVGTENQSKLLVKLSGIVSARNLDANEKIHKLMELVIQELGLSSTSLCVVDKEMCRILNFVTPPGNAPRNLCFSLNGSFIERIIAATEDVVVLNSTSYTASSHPLYSNSHPAIIVGCKLFSNDNLIGVLDFSSAFKKDNPLSKSELALIVIVASFVSEVMVSIKHDLMRKEEREHLQSESIIRKKGEDKFRQMDNLVRTVAHEYNNILVAIMGSCDLAMMDLPADSEVQRRLVLIQRSAQRAADLTEKLISYSGENISDLLPVKFSSFVRSVVFEVKEYLPSGVRLEFHDTTALLVVNVDSQKLRKVLVGVLNNSIESLGKRGGLVSVFTGLMHVDGEYLNQCRAGNSFSIGDYLYVKISDTGVGMTRECLLNVFNPVSSIRIGSKGIDLSEVLDVTIGHGGAVDVSSTLGVGTTVKMLFPILRVEQEPCEVCADEDIDAGIGESEVTVLIVDDEESVCLIAEEILRKAGYRTLQASNGTDAIEIFCTYVDDVHLAIIDMTMPDMTGFEVYERFREIRPDIPVIISSGYHRGTVNSDFAGKPYLDFVHKPFSPHELVDRVKFALRKKRSR